MALPQSTFKSLQNPNSKSQLEFHVSKQIKSDMKIVEQTFK